MGKGPISPDTRDAIARKLQAGSLSLAEYERRRRALSFPDKTRAGIDALTLQRSVRRFLSVRRFRPDRNGRRSPRPAFPSIRNLHYAAAAVPAEVRVAAASRDQMDAGGRVIPRALAFQTFFAFLADSRWSRSWRRLPTQQ